MLLARVVTVSALVPAPALQTLDGAVVEAFRTARLGSRHQPSDAR